MLLVWSWRLCRPLYTFHVYLYCPVLFSISSVPFNYAALILVVLVNVLPVLSAN